jgi:hypothetical protein
LPRTTAPAQGVLEVHAERPGHGLLDRADGTRAVLLDLVRELQGGLHDPVPRYHAVEHPEVVGLRSTDPVCCQQHLHGVAVGDVSRQVHGAAATGKQAPPGLRDAEARVLAGDTNVDAVEHLDAAGRACPIDGCDHRLVKREVAQDRNQRSVVGELVAPENGFSGGQLLHLFRDHGNEALEVGSDAEDVVYTGDDCGPELVIVSVADPRIGEVTEVLEIERVTPLGAVDGDDRFVTLLFEVNCHALAFPGRFRASR